MTATTLMGVSSAHAAATVARFDIGIRVESACGGDLVVSSGNLQVVTTPQNNGKFNQEITVKTTGVGFPSGADYVVNVHFHTVTTTASAEFRETTRLINKGSTVNTVVDLHGFPDGFGGFIVEVTKEHCVG